MQRSTLQPAGVKTLDQVMEDGVAFLENSGVLNQVRQLGIATTHWEDAVLAFRSTYHDPFTPNRIHSKLRERAEQFDAYALEVAANRPESLRLINDQVNPQIFIQFNK